MWETIEKVLTSGNGAIIFLLFATLVIVCSRWGIIKVKTDKLTIGRDSSENERTIIRWQTEYCKLSCKAFEQNIPKFESYNEYRGKYIIERCYDEMVTWIVFNNIKDEKTYISIKQEMIWNLVQELTDAESMKTKEFKKIVYDYIDNLIKNLVKIRREYRKEDKFYE